MMKMKKIIKNAAIALLFGTMIGSIGAFGVAYAEEPAGTKSLEGFTCPGASVYIATDGSGTKQMRFQIDLAKEQEEYKGEGKTAGVVVLPYDIYEQRGLTELTKETAGAAIADVTALWEENAEGNYSSYAYLDTKLIPAGQENRMLVARGYIEDGENVYYTEEVKASMAYVAWKNYDKMEEYRDVLKTYMGPYTLTYGTGENEKIENLYYGDALTLPEEVGGYKVDAWYWDSSFTQEIKPTDYATGSMQIYYELKKVDVSGNIVAPDGVDVTKTKIFAKGKDMNAVVDANGNFTIRLSISVSYDLVFENGDYIAFADGVVAGEDGVSDLSVTLKKNTWLAGNYGAVVSNNNPALNETGTYTISGQNQLTLFPNTATSEAFEYVVNVSNVQRSKDDSGYGIAVTDGKFVLSVFAYKSNSGAVVVNLSNKAGSGFINYYRNTLSNVKAGGTVKFVVSSKKIEFYANSALLFTFTKDEFTTSLTSLGWRDTLTANYQTAIAGFFADGAEIACGISSGLNGAVTATYACAIAKYATLSGTITAPAGVDVTATTLKVDGITTAISVQADGSYAVTVTEGTHNLLFENGLYVASEEVTFTTGENALNVTLADGTWLAGNYGAVVSNNNPDLNTDGTYTVTGLDQLTLFPRTATSEAFEYIVNVSNVQRSRDDSGYGIAVSDGKFVLSVFAYESNGAVIANLSSKAGAGYNTFYRNTLTGIRKGGNIKFVVSSEKIEFYAGSDLLFTFTSESFTSSLTNLNWGDSLTSNYKAAIAGFFADGAKIACGISNGFKASVTATYACAIAKYAAVSGTITAAEGVDLTTTTLTVDGIATPITVDENGFYTAYIAEGDHTLVFKNGVYSLTEEVTIVKGENSLDVTLIDCTWLAGNYGAVVSNNNPDLNTDGTYTIEGQNQLTLFPNTATSEAFEYVVNVSNVQRTKDVSGYGIAVSDGKFVLSVFVYESNGAVIANLSSKAGAGYNTFYRNTLTSIRKGGNIKFVVSSEKIEFYAGSDLLFTFTSESFTSALTNLGWGDSLTSNYQTAIAGFFADGAKIACGISSGFNASVTATYACAIAKYATVSGTISSATSTDLTATTLKVDGITTAITVQEDGSYISSIAEGAHTLVFENGPSVATEEITVVKGENILNVTLINSTWLAGNYGAVVSNNNPDLNETGTYTISGQNKLTLFPNTASSEAFEYVVNVSNVQRPKDDSGYGIAVSDGKYVLSVFVYESNGGVIANLSSKAGPSHNAFYRNTLTNIRKGGTIKFVVSSEKIEFYAGSDLLFTFTSESFTTSLSSLWNIDSLTASYKTEIAGFFADGAKIACGISSGYNASVTAKYTCSVTKN